MATNINSREARRRKIAARGSDRLALITGQIQTLQPEPFVSQLPDSSFPHPHPHPPPPPPPPHSPSQPQDSQTISSPPLITSHRDLQSHLYPDQITVSPHGNNEVSGSVLQENVSTAKLNEVNGSNGISSEVNLQSYKTSIEGRRAPLAEVSDRVWASSVSMKVQKSSIPSSEQPLAPLTHNRSVFTANNFSSAITALESTRIYCSATVALLVVLSYLGFPLLGSSFMKRTIFSRPLYLVLLTNLTIVIARLLEKQRNFRMGESGAADMVPSQQEYGWAEQVGKALEIGLVLKKVIDAVFIDCSIYAVIVICGLTLGQQLG